MSRKYPKELLESIVKGSLTITEVLTKLGLRFSGGSHGHIKDLIKKYGLDTSHFLGQRFHCGRKSHPNKYHWSEKLVLREGSHRREHGYILRRRLIESGREYKCVKCGNTGEWHGEPLVLQVNHRNGNWVDDRPENLEFRCPNCHSQTEGWSKTKGRVC